MKFATFRFEEEEIEMAPMIDMVFLLLIFFIVASHFNQLEQVDIEAPVADKATVAKDFSGRRTITIQADETIYVGAFPRELDEVQPLVEKTREKVPGLKIFLRADKRVKHKRVREVMQACAQAGAAEIIFATLEQE